MSASGPSGPLVKYVILILRKEKYILGRIDLYFWGFTEKLVFFLGILGAKAKYFREPRKLFSGIWRDQCIIFRDQGSTDSPGGLISGHWKSKMDFLNAF